MKGVVFNLLEKFVSEKFGDQFYEELISNLHLQNIPFIAPKTYPDEIFLKLVDELTRVKQIDINHAIKIFGFYCYPHLESKIKYVIKNLKTPEEILLHLDDIVHVEVKKILINAEVPRFNATKAGDHVKLQYFSKRKLCPFVEGLIEGLAEKYNKTIIYTHDKCLKSGEDCCEFKISFNKK